MSSFQLPKLFVVVLLAASVSVLIAPGPVIAQTSVSAPLLLTPTEFFRLDITNGSVEMFDKGRRDPLSLRRQRLTTNVFQEVGRPLDQPAQVNEVMLAPIRTNSNSVRALMLLETTTGYIAYFDQLGRNGRFGRITTVAGRPFAQIASGDANFALLPKNSSSGATLGFFLYHATSGNVTYLSNVGNLDVQPSVRRHDPLPVLGRKVASTAIRAAEETIGYVLVDGFTGDIVFVELETEGVDRLVPAASQVSLLQVFEQTPRHLADGRFVVTGIEDRSQSTTHLFFADVGTGDLAVMSYDTETESPGRLSKLSRNAYSVLPSATTENYRSLTLTTRRDPNHATEGIWIGDSQSGSLVYVSNPQTAGSAIISRVRNQ